jgi:ABC-type transport system involved in cytochrome bd biosynthesis fused ATPase/permease subunit
VWRWRDAGKAIVVVTHLLNQLDRVDTVVELPQAAAGDRAA